MPNVSENNLHNKSKSFKNIHIGDDEDIKVKHTEKLIVKMRHSVYTSIHFLQRAWPYKSKLIVIWSRTINMC